MVRIILSFFLCFAILAQNKPSCYCCCRYYYYSWPLVINSNVDDDCRITRISTWNERETRQDVQEALPVRSPSEELSSYTYHTKHSFSVQISGNVFSVPSIPIPNGSFPFQIPGIGSFRSHSLPILAGFSHSLPLPFPYCLVTSISSDNKCLVQSPMHGTLTYCYKKKKNQPNPQK